MVAERKEGFDAPITVQNAMESSRNWFSTDNANSKGQNEITYTINANSSAALKTWHMALMEESNAGNGQILASTELTPVTVAEPYLGMKIEMAAVEQGQDGLVICKLTHATPFEE